MRAAAVVFLFAWTAVGCASVDVKGRDILRVGPLRDAAIAPARVDTAPLSITAGADVLTDEELLTLRRDLPAAFAGHVEDAAAAVEGGPLSVGVARVTGCRLRAGPGRAHTTFIARCRAVVEVDGAALVEVEAEALRRVRSRTISEDQAKEIRQLVRNPLLSFDDSRAALDEAARAAAELVVTGALKAQAAPERPALSRAEQRSLALDRLQRAQSSPDKAAAAVDLGESGRPDDARAIVALLADEIPLVRRAVAVALGELCLPETDAALAARAEDDDEGVRAAVALARRRVSACSQVKPTSP